MLRSSVHYFAPLQSSKIEKLSGSQSESAWQTAASHDSEKEAGCDDLNILALGTPKFVGDGVHGVGHVEMALRRTGKGFLLGVNAHHWFILSART